MDGVSIDSTSIRAQAQTARAREKRGAEAQGLARSCGGLGSKIHAAFDALGLPVRLALGSIEIHLEFKTAAQAWMIDLKVRSVFSDRKAIAL